MALSISLLSRILLLWRFLLTRSPPDSCISPDTVDFKHWTPPHLQICGLDHSEENIGADILFEILRCVCPCGAATITILLVALRCNTEIFAPLDYVSFGPVKFCISFFLILFESISSSVLKMNLEAKHLFSSYGSSVGRCGIISWSSSMCK